MWHPREAEPWGPHARGDLPAAGAEHAEGAAAARPEGPDGLQRPDPRLQGTAPGPGQDWGAVSNSPNPQPAGGNSHLLTWIFSSLSRNVDLNPSLSLEHKLLLLYKIIPLSSFCFRKLNTSRIFLGRFLFLTWNSNLVLSNTMDIFSWLPLAYLAKVWWDKRYLAKSDETKQSYPSQKTAISIFHAFYCYRGSFNNGPIMVNWYPLLATCVNYSEVTNATLNGKKSGWKYCHFLTPEGAKVCVFYLKNLTNFWSKWDLFGVQCWESWRRDTIAPG